MRALVSRGAGLAAGLAALISTPAAALSFPVIDCPVMYKKAVLNLPYNAAFLHVDRFDQGGDGLIVNSFYNVAKNPAGMPPVFFLTPDKAALIRDLDSLPVAPGGVAVTPEILTDLANPAAPKTVWPNETQRVPDGVLPFEAVVIPQGFHTAASPGRLTLVNLSDPARQEYLVHQSTQTGPFTFPGDPSNSPRFYHNVVFLDMDGDGLKDMVTARSGFRVGAAFHPPFSELVYFRNPGAALDANTPWQEVVLYGGPAAGFLGPDIAVDAHDFDGDGVVEIVATHFFSGDSQVNGKIALFGAPEGGDWSQVNASQFRLPRVKVLNADQGLPFGVEIVDLNRDGRADILATNHQPDNCKPSTSSAVPGRVYALSMPASGDIFGADWNLHILKDDIRPQPSLGGNPPGRLAPGRAHAFQPLKLLEHVAKPYVAVGGDEAGKVWVLRPTKPWDPSSWEYQSSVIFDINDHYGEFTTQTELSDPYGISISTVGGFAVRYDQPGPFGVAELYVPVFEGRDIHVFSFRHQGRKGERVRCGSDALYACPAP